MLYKWQDNNSIIKEIEFFKPYKKEEALIYPPPPANTDPEKLYEIVDKLHAYGLSAIPDTQRGEPVLRVSNFSSKEALIELLEREGYISGKPVQKRTDLDRDSRWRPSTLQLAGALQVLADALIVGTALKTRGKEGIGDIKASGGWILNYAILAAFGAKNPDKQTAYIYKDLQEHFKRAGVELDADDAAALKALSENGGLASSMERLVREHPIQINALMNLYGGIQNWKAGKAQTDHTGKPGYWKMASGVLTATGNTLGGLVIQPKEKPVFDRYVPEYNHGLHDEDQGDKSASSPNGEEKKGESVIDTIKGGVTGGDGVNNYVSDEYVDRGPIENIVNKIHERPLIIAGTMSIMSNMARLANALTERFQSKKYFGGGKDDKDSIYAKELKKLQDEIKQHKGNDLQSVLNEGLEINDHILSGKDLKGAKLRRPLSGSELRKAIEEYRQENQKYDSSLNIIEKYEKFIETSRKMRAKGQAGSMEFVANGIKAVSNLLIGLSSSNIDANLEETGQLDEITGFFAHVIKAQPPEKRELTLHSMASLITAQDGVEMTENDIRNKILDKLKALDRNPWERHRDKESVAAAQRQNNIPSSKVGSIASHAIQSHDNAVEVGLAH